MGPPAVLGARIAAGAAVFLAAGALLLQLLALLPSHSAESVLSLRAEDVAEWAAALSAMYRERPAVVLGVFSYLYVFKQVFAIPGSFFLNLLAGAVFGLRLGFPLTATLTAVGASGAFLLSRLLAQPVVLHYFPERLEQLRARLMAHTTPLALLLNLISLRVFPFTPNWFVNLASPVVGVPLPLFSLSVFVGLMPYNFVCCQAGQVASSVRSAADVLTADVLLKLLLVAAILVLPNLAKRLLHPRAGPPERAKSHSL